MKFLSLMIISFSITTQVFAQTCLPNGITFTSQWQIDNFSANYPGCSIVLGDLIIDYIEDIDVTNVDSLIHLTEIQGDLSITIQYGSPFLSNLEGLSNINSVGGDLKIGGSYSLYSLGGLENVSTIGGQLFIDGNPYLSNLIGLNNLYSVGSITIYNNNDLTSLTGIDSVDYTTLSSLTISHNDELTWCSIYSVCNYINSEDPNVIISYNNIGCGNQTQVEEMCVTSINNYNKQSITYRVQPNPVINNLEIIIEDHSLSNIQIQISNLQGKVFLTNSYSADNNIIDVTYLTPGMYILQVEFENGDTDVRKFVKL